MGPFAGVPLLAKDSGATLKGQPTYSGNKALRDLGFRSPVDTYLGRRLKEIGFVTLGRTNLPEFGLQMTTQPLAFGATRNPWNLTHSSGGSSGGSCAAVAAGLTPIAFATDGGGSIRIPSAWCGVVGLKPTRGRVSTGDANVHRNLHAFTVARIVRDVAAMLDLLQGNQPGDLFLAPLPAQSYRKLLTQRPVTLRIGLMTKGLGHELHADVAATLDAVGKRLQALGHSVEVAWPQALERSPYLAPPSKAVVSLFRSAVRGLEPLLRRPVTADDVEPFTWAVADPNGPVIPAEELTSDSVRMQAWAIEVCRWWQTGFDVLVTPTTPEPAPTLPTLTPPASDPASFAMTIAKHAAFTSPFNVTGQPAISLPLGQSGSGLPIGIQFVADTGREDLLVRLAKQLEEAMPWRDCRPAMI